MDMIDPKKIEEWTERMAFYSSVERYGGKQARDEGQADVAREALPALLAEREEMLAVLREVEWNGDSAVFECPICRGEWDDLHHFGQQHAPNCRLAALLNGA